MRLQWGKNERGFDLRSAVAHCASRKASGSSKMKPIEYSQASAEVRTVFDDIKTTRKVEDVNNFWKYLANEPRMLKHVWASLKDVMGQGALDPLTKELIYVAVSITNNCEYCMASHGFAA